LLKAHTEHSLSLGGAKTIIVNTTPYETYIV